MPDHTTSKGFLIPDIAASLRHFVPYYTTRIEHLILNHTTRIRHPTPDHRYKKSSHFNISIYIKSYTFLNSFMNHMHLEI